MIPLYTDENIRGSVIRGLRMRQIDLITAAEDGHDHTDDEIVLQRSSNLGRLLVTYDEDFESIAASWNQAGRPFTGVIKSHPDRVSVGVEIDQLHLICNASVLDEYINRVIYLPLR